MNNPQLRSVPYLIITAGILLLLLAGCSKKAKIENTSDWIAQKKTSVYEVVKDSQRAQQIVNEFEQLDLKMNAWEVYLGEHKSEMDKLNADYDISREELRAFIDGYNTKRHALKEEMLASRFKIKELATKDEWEKFADQEETLFQQWWKESSNMTEPKTLHSEEIS